MYCTHCGNYMDDNAIFCPVCGHKVGRRARHEGNIMDDFGREDYGYSYGKSKSRLTAMLLAVFLGTFGIHDFYLGYTKSGIAKILLTMFALGFVSELWSLTDAVKIYRGRVDCDANGLPLI